MANVAINKLRRQLNRQKLDALLITKKENLAYLSGFQGEGALLITPEKAILVVDFRFKEQAEQETKSLQICSRPSFSALNQDLQHLIKSLRLKKIGFEARAVSCASLSGLKKALKPLRLLPTINSVEDLRIIKSAREIMLLKKAAGLALKSFAFAKRLIKAGITERALAREIQYFILNAGAESCAFEMIVASGKRSSLPHAPLSRKTIKNNEPVLVDLGCRICGYNSDLTRVVFLGKISGKLKRIYDIVFQAQQLAIKEVKAGVRACDIDRVARRYISQKGLGAFFGHALGHGIGREVHEAPYISPRNKDVLKEGMVLTIEPGVYIPGLGGIRIEDMVLVTKTGPKMLTR